MGNFATAWVFREYRGALIKAITPIHAKVFDGEPFTIVPMKHPARISHGMLMEIEVVLQRLMEGSSDSQQRQFRQRNRFRKPRSSG